MRTISDVRNDIRFYKQAQEEWRKAYIAVAQGGQSYEIRDGDATRVLTRANLNYIETTLQKISTKLSNLNVELEQLLQGNLRPSRIVNLRGC